MNITSHRVFKKAILLGDSGVGKTSLYNTMKETPVHEEEPPTLGGDMLRHIERYQDIEVDFEVWDTAGQEQYLALTTLYYKDANVVLAVYDITSRSSFEKIDMYLNTFEKTNGTGASDENIVTVLIGNKKDYARSREVPTEEAQQFAEENNFIFLETSAKTRENTDKIFPAIIERMKTNSDLLAPVEQPCRKLEFDEKPQARCKCK